MPSTIVAGGDLYIVRPTASLTVDAAHGLLANDTDVGGGGLSVVSYTQPKYGSVSVAPDGSFVFTGPTSQDLSAIGGPSITSLGQSGSGGVGALANTFTYTLKDAAGATQTGTSNLEVLSDGPQTSFGMLQGSNNPGDFYDNSGQELLYDYSIGNAQSASFSASAADGVLAHVGSPLGLPLHVVAVSNFQGSWASDGSFTATSVTFANKPAIFYISDGFEISALKVVIAASNTTGPNILGDRTITYVEPGQSILVKLNPTTDTTYTYNGVTYPGAQVQVTNTNPGTLNIDAPQGEGGGQIIATASSTLNNKAGVAQIAYVKGGLTEVPGVQIGIDAGVFQVADDSYAVAADRTTKVSSSAGVLANDATIKSTIHVSSFNQPSHGSVQVNSDGSFTYTPVAGYIGTDSFNYVVTDLYGDTSFPIGVNTAGVPDTPGNRPAQVTLNVVAGGFVTVTGTVGGQSTLAGTPLNPFAQAAVADSVGGADTVTVTFDKAAGVLSGGGFTGADGVYTVVASSAGQATADLRAAVFTPAAGAAAAATTFTIGVVDGDNAATDSATTVTVGTGAAKPTISGTTPGRTSDDVTASNPFPQVALGGPSGIEKVTITYAAADGSLSGGGFSGSPGAYAATFASPAAAQAALRMVVFTPTMNEVAPGQSVTTTFTLQANIAGVTTVDATTSLTSLSLNDPPVLGDGVAAQAATAGVPLSPFAATTLADPDTGQTETVTVSFAAGAGTFAGAGFTGSGGTYTGAFSSASAAQAALRAATFTPLAGQTATTTLTLSVSDGSASATESSTSVAAVYTAVSNPGGGGGGSGGGGGGTAPSAPASVSSGFSAVEAPNLLRASVSDLTSMPPGTSLFAQFQAQKLIAAQLDMGQITQAQAEISLNHLVDGTTAVAVADYAFFTGFTPTAQGLNYLVHSPNNATDLNDSYYASFSTENRYINFAVNLATGSGAGASAFHADYGALSLQDATAKAYAAVFGSTADAAKVSALLDTLVPDGLGGQETRAAYFAQYGGDGPNGQGTKAAMIGFLLANAVHDGSGVYGAATENYLFALAHGQAPAMGSELALHYGAPVSLVGAAPSADPTVTG